MEKKGIPFGKGGIFRNSKRGKPRWKLEILPIMYHIRRAIKLLFPLNSRFYCVRSRLLDRFSRVFPPILLASGSNFRFVQSSNFLDAAESRVPN